MVTPFEDQSSRRILIRGLRVRLCSVCLWLLQNPRGSWKPRGLCTDRATWPLKAVLLQTRDNIVCLASRQDRKTAYVSRVLSKNGFHSNLLDIQARDPVVAGLEAAFSFQYLALELARSRRLKEVAFLLDRKKLRLSSSLIY